MSMSSESSIKTTSSIREEIQSLFSLNELFEMGVHFGSRYSEPIMTKKYIYPLKHNNSTIFDLEKTAAMLVDALEKIYEIVASGKSILMVCTKKTNTTSALVKEMNEICGQYYLTKRWMPGLLTNKTTLKKSIEKIELLKIKLSKDKRPGRSQKIDATELHKKESKVEGILTCNFDNIGAVVVLYSENLGIIAHECNLANIPLIAICDSDTKDHIVTKVNYIIPANDDCIKAIYVYLKLISHVARKGLEFLYNKIKKNKDVEDNSIMNKLLKEESVNQLKNATKNESEKSKTETDKGE